MKKHILIILALLVLVGSHLVVWSVSYARGIIRSATIGHGMDLAVTLRTHDALESRDLDEAERLVQIELRASVLCYTMLQDNPYGYVCQSLDDFVNITSNTLERATSIVELNKDSIKK